jgi:uncharacterized membrane protein HdeD (DUF308 family)
MNELSKLWWVNVVRGVAAIIFGIMMLIWPYYSIFIVAVLFASLLLIYGISDIVTGALAIGKNGISYIAKILLGILEAGTGAFLLYKAGSGLTLKLIGLLVAVNLIVIAIVNISVAFIDKTDAGYRWAVGLSGVFAFFIGVIVAGNPAAAAASLIWVFGVFGLFFGPLEIASGFMLKKENN